MLKVSYKLVICAAAVILVVALGILYAISRGPSEDKIQNNRNHITAEEAETIALTHAGLTKDDIKIVKLASYDKKDRTLYDIEFLSSTTKYSYEIDAVNGEVIAYYTKDVNKSE